MCLVLSRWIQRSSLWFVTWGNWWRTTGWGEQTNSDEHIFRWGSHFVSINNHFLFSDRWRHHHHSVPDGVSLHFKICLLTTRAAGRGQRSFLSFLIIYKTCSTDSRLVFPSIYYLWSLVRKQHIWPQDRTNRKLQVLGVEVVFHNQVKYTHRTFWLDFLLLCGEHVANQTSSILSIINRKRITADIYLQQSRSNLSFTHKALSSWISYNYKILKHWRQILPNKGFNRMNPWTCLYCPDLVCHVVPAASVGTVGSSIIYCSFIYLMCLMHLFLSH